MNVALVISYYDEEHYVLETIKNFKLLFSNCKVFCVQSDPARASEQSLLIRQISDFHTTLPDLSVGAKHWCSYQAVSLSRNFSLAFSEVYRNNEAFDCICALTGDTHVFDPSFVPRVFDEMKKNKKLVALSQAIGEHFHAATDDITNSSFGRFQHKDITDFMPQLFIVDGDFAIKTRCFSDIMVTNVWTSEQCLGDTLSKNLNKINNFDFKQNVYTLAHGYDFKDGVKYHAPREGRPGR
jgi:hypothetical protein